MTNLILHLIHIVLLTSANKVYAVIRPSELINKSWKDANLVSSYG